MIPATDHFTPGKGVFLSPVTHPAFMADYWEKKPLHVERADKNYFSAHVSISAIESLLSTAELFFPAVQLTRADASVALGDYADEDHRILPVRLIQHYHSGATVVISQAHNCFASLAGLCRDAESRFQMQCQANVYLSPAGKQGFKAHFDSHDVFILQVSGSKTFRFYAGGAELPLRSRRFDSAVDTAGELQEEVSLSAGDTLYIPRGVMHDAQADLEEPSLHITLGVFPVTVSDLLQQMIQIATEQGVAYRRALPVSLLAADQQHLSCDAQAIETIARDTFGHGSGNSVFDQALVRLKDDAALRGKPDCTGLLAAVRQNAPLALDSVLVLNPRNSIQAERTGDQVRLRTAGRVLEFNDPVAAAVESVLAAGCTRVGDLPGLQPERQLALCQHLLDEFVIENS